MAHPNEELLRNGYAAFEKGDLDTLRGLFADDIVWHSPGKGPLACDYRGIDGMSIDTKGNLFATAGREETAGVYVFSPEGKKLAFLPTPETPTNCCFGGDDFKTLYVTAGKSLYRVTTNVEGFAVFRPGAKK